MTKKNAESGVFKTTSQMQVLVDAINLLYEQMQPEDAPQQFIDSIKVKK